MNKRRIAIAAAALGMISLTAGWTPKAALPDTPGRGIILQEVLSIGSPDDEMLLQWTGVATDAHGFIYVLDGLDFALKKFDARGRFLGKTGRQGRGPGEFMAPRLLAAAGGRLFATDQSVPGIMVYDSDLRFQKTIPFGRPVSMLVPAGEERLAVAALSIIGSSARVSVIDGTGAAVSEFAFLPKVEFYLADAIAGAVDASGNFYIAYFFQDRIEKRDPRGRLLWAKTPPRGGAVETKPLKAGGLEIKLPSKTYYKDVALDREGRVLVLCGGQSKHPGRDVLVLAPDGTSLTEFMLPDTSHCLHVDERGFLYARANDGMTLKKFRMDGR